VIGVGIDTVDVGRFALVVTRRKGLAERVFTPGEIAVASGSMGRLAARFAAKEAAIKVFGLVDGIDHRSVEVLTHPDGRPELLLRGQAAAHAAKLGLTSHSLSLAHEAEYAVAVVVALVAP
jgi:holo-[acyl-carrier protein] synthase